MTKKPKLCMFCGKDKTYGSMSREHFVPKCLWEDGKRPRLMRTLPAHKLCNEEFCADNEYFRDVLIMEHGAVQNSEAAKAVSDGTMTRKFKHHFGSLCKAAQDLNVRPVTTRSGIFIGNHPTYVVDWSRIRRVLHNVMKGIFYTATGKPMPSEFMADVQDVCSLGAVDIAMYQTIVDRMVPWQDFGDDGFACRYGLHAQTDVLFMACVMKFYRNRTFLGIAYSPTFLPESIAQML